MAAAVIGVTRGMSSFSNRASWLLRARALQHMMASAMRRKSGEMRELGAGFDTAFPKPAQCDPFSNSPGRDAVRSRDQNNLWDLASDIEIDSSQHELHKDRGQPEEEEEEVDACEQATGSGVWYVLQRSGFN
eukprot:5732624-Prymnesium_polylepis.1